MRYADDTIVGFEHRHEAEQFLADLKARLARFGLALHPDKTRLIEFGRCAIANRRTQGLGKPKSFDFLGFTHYCATRRSGSGFVLGRKPVRKRMRAKLREIREQLMAIRHEGTERQGRWLRQVLRGWMAYYAVPMSGSAISALRHHMIERWHGALMRRSQRRRLTWTRMKKIADRHLPFPRILHPWPEKRFLVTIQGGSPVRQQRPMKAAPAIRAAMSPSNVSLALLRGETVKDTAHAKAIVAELSDMMLNRRRFGALAGEHCSLKEINSRGVD